MSESRRGNPLARIVQVATKVEPNEQKATLLSFLFVFVLMAAYFILRPVRDALSSEWTDEQLSWLWTSTFVEQRIEDRRARRIGDQRRDIGDVRE